MSKDYFYNAAKVIKAEWLPKMQGLYNFEISKHLHSERLKQLDFDKLVEEISLL